MVVVTIVKLVAAVFLVYIVSQVSWYVQAKMVEDRDCSGMADVSERGTQVCQESVGVFTFIPGIVVGLLFLWSVRSAGRKDYSEQSVEY